MHDDSDKTYGGRRFVADRIGPHLAPGATVVMDDIQDNLDFAELVERRGGAFAVFEPDGCFNGVTTW